MCHTTLYFCAKMEWGVNKIPLYFDGLKPLDNIGKTEKQKCSQIYT